MSARSAVARAHAVRALSLARAGARILTCEAEASQHSLTTPHTDITYYLGRESLVAGSGGSMGTLSESIFRTLMRNSLPATAYFRLPPEQVVEIGLHIDL